MMYKDRVYERPRAMDQSIKIIGIDEATLAELGPFGTWPRSTYANLLDILGDHPSVVAFDIMMMGNLDESDDEIFAKKVADRDDVILASHLVYETKIETDAQGKVSVNPNYIREIEVPFCDEYVVTGYVNTAADSDGTVRRILPFSTYVTEEGEEQKLQSFSYAIYSMYADKTGLVKSNPKLDGLGSQWIYYAGKPGDYEVIPLINVLNGKVDPRVFNDCIVMVGAYATGLQDQFAVPNSTNQMFGVEMNANIVQSYIDEVYPRPLSKLLVVICITLISMLCFLAMRCAKVRWSSVIFVISEVIVVFAGILLYLKAQIIFPSVYLILGLALSYIVSLVTGYLNEWLQKRKIAGVFRKYVAPQVVDEIMKSGQYKIKLGGENRDIAVLFVDIRGFTPLSESLPPEQVVEILNEYLNLTTNAIFKNDGTLDKFIGDATMAVFNAPFDLEDYEYKAVCAAWDIVAGAKDLEEKCMKEFGKKVQFGVGVNCGEAVVGNIGCDFRMDYTAIGDTVNTSARLEANAKAGQVLISEYIYERLKDRVTVKEVGEIPLKGKSKGVFVYELTGIM